MTHLDDNFEDAKWAKIHDLGDEDWWLKQPLQFRVASPQPYWYKRFELIQKPGQKMCSWCNKIIEKGVDGYPIPDSWMCSVSCHYRKNMEYQDTISRVYLLDDIQKIWDEMMKNGSFSYGFEVQDYKFPLLSECDEIPTHWNRFKRWLKSKFRKQNQ